MLGGSWDSAEKANCSYTLPTLCAAQHYTMPRNGVVTEPPSSLKPRHTGEKKRKKLESLILEKSQVPKGKAKYDIDMYLAKRNQVWSNLLLRFRIKAEECQI